MNVQALPVRYGVGTMTAGLLRQRAKEFHGLPRNAFNRAADNVSVGMPIPSYVRSIIDHAMSFNQNKYGK